MRKQITLFILILSICHFSEAQLFDTLNIPSNLPAPSQPKFLKISPSNDLYIGSTRGLLEYSNNNWNSYTNANGLPTNFITCIAFQGSNQWIGTTAGLVLKNGSQFSVYNTSNSGITNNFIISLFVDSNEIWIGTYNKISIYDGLNWTTIDPSAIGLTNTGIKNICKTRFGIYVLDYRGNISVKTTSGWFSINNSRTYFRNTISRLAYFNDSTLIIPAMGAFIRDTTLTIFNVNNISPCLLGNTIAPLTAIWANPITGVHYLNVGTYPKNNYLFQMNDLNPNFNTIYFLADDTLSTAIKSFADTDLLYDFDVTGKYYAFSKYSNGTNRTVISSYINSFPISLPPTSCPFLDINQVRARIWNNGSLFWDLIGNAQYEVPKGSGKNAIFANGFWIGGKDPGDQIHVAAQTYRQSGSDFWPGPLDTLNASIDSATTSQYDSLWKIDRTVIDDFRYQFAIGNVQNGTYIIPSIILNWPANGSGTNAHQLAPYFDYNSDGIYNPFDGDYPDIKGSQMIWWVFNDSYSTHGETNGSFGLGVEIQASAYAYNCPTAMNDDSVINYTTFYHYDIYNRSDTNYHDVYIGIHTDTDLGNYLDDYVGCDTLNNFGFTCNGDDDDEGSLGYGLHPPMMNTLVLQGPEADINDGVDNNHNGIIDEPGEHCMMNHFTYYNNDGSNIGNPNTSDHYYNFLHSVWKDGVPVTYGGTGYDQLSTNYTNFMFSGIPYDSLPWTEWVPTAGGNSLPNQPDDRRFIISSGPFTLDAHQKKSIDIAYVYTREPRYPNGPTTSIAKNLQDVLKIKQYFNSNNFPCDNIISVPELNQNNLMLFPNPADAYFKIEFPSIINGEISITNLLGQQVNRVQRIFGKSITINTSELKPGIYFITIQSGNQRITKKLQVFHPNE